MDVSGAHPMTLRHKGLRRVHELSIAQNLLDIVMEEGRRHGLGRVFAVRLEIGALAAVVPEALTFCFDILTRDTIAAGAELDITTLPAVARCVHCREVFAVAEQWFQCPQCNEPGAELVSGRQLTITAIEGERGEGDDGSENPGGAQHPGSQ
jgi:hydrogenase nickel incorporation protein HypA/HybF